MRKQLPSGKEASQREGSILLNYLDGRFPVTRKLSVGIKLISGRSASLCEGSFLVGRELSSGNQAF